MIHLIPVLAAVVLITGEPLDLPRGEPATFAQAVRQDPADSLYRAAREALNRGDYREAAQRFQELRERYPESAYTAESFYWEAFALYRTGRTEDLEVALEALRMQQERHPETPTRRDAETLAVRIQGLLAERGNAEAALRIVEQARRSAREEALAAQAAEVAALSDELRRAQTSQREVGAQEQDPCPDDDSELRVAALNALARMDANTALPLLRQVLAERDECSMRLRESAVFLLGHIDSPEVADILIEVIRNDPSVEVRRGAVGMLAEVDAARTTDVLEEILRTPDDSALHEIALFALARHSGERATASLRAVAADAGYATDVRRTAIGLLADQPSSENAAFLRDLYPRLEAPDLREAALFSLARTESEENAQWLLDRVRDPREPAHIRSTALALVGEMETVPVSTLVDLYDSATDREMKEQLILVLGRRDEPEAVDKLIEILRGENDPQLRETAVYLLGESGDPRATQALVELIRNP